MACDKAPLKSKGAILWAISPNGNKTASLPAVHITGQWLKAAGFDTGQRRDQSNKTTKPTTASTTE